MQYQQNCTYQVTLQPSSKMMFEGDWGCCPNKQFLKIEPKAKLKKWVNLYGLHCLPKSVHLDRNVAQKLYSILCVKIQNDYFGGDKQENLCYSDHKQRVFILRVW